MADARKDPILEANETVERYRTLQINGTRQGEVAIFTCPDCSGTLWQVDDDDIVQFRCHVGHIVSAEDLFLKQTEAAENALWYAIRTFTDKQILARQIIHKLQERNGQADTSHYENESQDAGEQATAIRRIAERTRPFTAG